MSDQQVITGKFLGALPTETVGQNGFLVRRFFLDNTTNPDWPSTPEFKLKGDRVNLVDQLAQGQTIQVSYNIQGTKFDKRATGGKQGVITELIAWRINLVQMQSAAAAPPVNRPVQVPPASTANRAMSPPASSAFQHMGEGDDDLPF